MKQTVAIFFRQEPHRSIIYLISLMLLRASIQISLYRQGFISVAADEFSRGIRAARWAEDPGINLLADAKELWLPLEKYLNGLFLLIWPDVLVAPRVTVFLASCLLLLTLYLLAYYLFDNVIVAILSTLYITFQPWFIWLSGTPMLEMYYFAPFFAGLFFLIRWLAGIEKAAASPASGAAEKTLSGDRIFTAQQTLRAPAGLKERHKWDWFWAGICFMGATGLHVQSWTFINLINLLTLPLLYHLVRNKAYQSVIKLVAFYFLSNGFIIYFTLIEFITSGKIFAFLANHTTYSKWFFNGYNVTIWEKFLFYPRIVVRNASSVVWLCLFIALLFLIREANRRWQLFPLLLATLALLLNSSLNILSGPPSAAADRYAVFYAIILSLYIGYATFQLFHFRWRRSPKLTNYLATAVSLFLFTYGLWWGASRYPDYPRGMSLDPVAVGQELNLLLEDNPGAYMVELSYWEYLAVDLTSRHYDQMLFDREQDYFNRETPSIFAQALPDICRSLAVQDIHYVVLRDEEIKKTVQQLAMLRLNQHVGAWSIYEIVPGASCIREN